MHFRVTTITVQAPIFACRFYIKLPLWGQRPTWTKWSLREILDPSLRTTGVKKHRLYKLIVFFNKYVYLIEQTCEASGVSMGGSFSVPRSILA